MIYVLAGAYEMRRKKFLPCLSILMAQAGSILIARPGRVSKRSRTAEIGIGGPGREGVSNPAFGRLGSSHANSAGVFNFCFTPRASLGCSRKHTRLSDLIGMLVQVKRQELQLLTKKLAEFAASESIANLAPGKSVTFRPVWALQS